MKNRLLALVGGIFHRNEKIQKTKVIYFMFGTYCRLGVPKIQKVQIITPPPLPTGTKVRVQSKESESL